MSADVMVYVPFSEIADINPRRRLRTELVPFVEMAAVRTDLPHVDYLQERPATGSGSTFQNGDTLFARITPCAENGKTSFVDYLPSGIVGMGSTEFIVFGPRIKLVEPKYLYWLARSEIVRRPAIESMEGTSGRQRVPNWVFQEIVVPLPPRAQQQRIVEILQSVDDSIKNTRAVIDQTRKVKRGLLRELLTRGIGHTQFKETSIGKMPVNWTPVRLGDVLQPHMPPIELLDDEIYAPTIVRRNHNGIETRQLKQGKDILVKQQYRVVPGTFLISRRQIIHKACGVVPEGLQRAIISKEYLALRAKPTLDVRFIDYYSRTSAFQRAIARCTYGIDDEKFVFNDRWWFNEKMPVPPREEQERICNSLDAVEQQEQIEEQRLARLEVIKEGLIEDLLTGRVRVPTS